MNRNFIALAALFAGLVMGSLLTVQLMDRTAPEPEIASYEMPHVKRPNRVVADIERSLTLYRDILGLTAADIQVSGPDSFSYPVFNIPEGTPMRSVTLHEPGEQRVFAFTEVKGLDLPRPISAPYMNTAVIGITDLKGKFEQIEALGLTVTETRIAGGEEFTFIEQAFVDFDGHLIVCYEVLPVSL